MISDPLGLAEDIDRATQALLTTAGGLDDSSVAGASLLPDWSRGHVLAHIARNADGAVNLLTWARTGVETPQYASQEQRNLDIEAGAPRGAADQLADLTAACARFADAVAQMPAEAWTVEVRWTAGNQAPAARVMWSRLREVEIHHVDLGAGYTPADWPEAFTLRLLRETAHRFADPSRWYCGRPRWDTIWRSGKARSSAARPRRSPPGSSAAAPVTGSPSSRPEPCRPSRRSARLVA